VFSAGGPPFFGLLFDYTQSYILSFSIFIGLLFASAFLSLFLRPPKSGFDTLEGANNRPEKKARLR
jgi:cyanate permease